MMMKKDETLFGMSCWRSTLTKRVELLLLGASVLSNAGCTPAARTAPVEITADGTPYIACAGAVQIEKDSNAQEATTYSMTFTEGTVTHKELHGVHNVTLTKNAREPACDLMTIVASNHRTVKEVPPDAVEQGWEQAFKMCPLGNYKAISGFSNFTPSSVVFDAPSGAVRVANTPLPSGTCKWIPASSVESTKADNWFVTESYHFVAADPVVFVGPSETELGHDSSFQAATQADQIAYLSSVDPAFARAAKSDQLAYLSHVHIEETFTNVQPLPRAENPKKAHAPRRVKALFNVDLTTSELGNLKCGHVDQGDLVILLEEGSLGVRVKTSAGQIGWAYQSAFEVVK